MRKYTKSISFLLRNGNGRFPSCLSERRKNKIKEFELHVLLKELYCSRAIVNHKKTAWHILLCGEET